MDHRYGVWAARVLERRNPDGMWGNFHALSEPKKNGQITTEQALRRLWILGYGRGDDVVKALLEKMCWCLETGGVN